MKTHLPIVIHGLSLLVSPLGIAEDAQKPTTMTRQAENIIPVLPVRDLARSIDFYTNKLGFKLDWGGASDTVCGISRDKCPVMLQVREKIDTPSWVWVGCEATLFDTFRAAGAKVFQEPKNHTWAYEMKFEDIDGNILWLGSDPRKDIPFEDAKKK
jgi:predicted lactoylglutathione lyase